MYSIIVACYNVEQYIDECVLSLIQQSYHDIEILLVDDGSTDSTLEKCYLWNSKDSRIRVIHQENAGAGDARNTGLKYSRGEYLFFVDGDDFIETQYVEKMNSVIKNSYPDMIITNHEYHLLENGVQIEKKCFPLNEIEESNQSFLDFIFSNNYFLPGATWHNVYKTEFVKANNILFGTYKISEDLDFFLQIMIKKPRYVFSDEKYYHYRRRNSSAITSLTTQKLLDRICVLKKWWDVSDVDGVVTQEKMQRWIANNLYGNLVFTIPITHPTIDYKKLKEEYIKDSIFSSYYSGLTRCMKIFDFRFILVLCKMIGYGREVLKIVSTFVKK